MTSLQYFDNISFHISPNNKKLDISKIYTKWAVEKCPSRNLQTPRKLRNSKIKSGQCFAGHPVDSQSPFYSNAVCINLVDLAFLRDQLVAFWLANQTIRLNKPSTLNFGFLQSLEVLKRFFLMLWQFGGWLFGCLAVWRFHCDYTANSAQLHWDLG